MELDQDCTASRRSDICNVCFGLRPDEAMLRSCSDAQPVTIHNHVSAEANILLA